MSDRHGHDDAERKHAHPGEGGDHPDNDEPSFVIYVPRPGVLGWLDRLGIIAIKTIVYSYRFTLSPFIGGGCRFYPTCSQYMLDAVAKYGPWRGGWRGTLRVLRCNPFCKGGFDPA